MNLWFALANVVRVIVAVVIAVGGVALGSGIAYKAVTFAWKIWEAR